MDARIFCPEPMNLKEELLTLPLEERLIYDPAENLFFVNFEGFYIKNREQIRKIRSLVEKTLAPLGQKVYTFVNYDNFNILPELVDEYTDMVKDLVVNYYERGDPLYHQHLPAHETRRIPGEAQRGSPYL